jgi:hypothetical protein
LRLVSFILFDWKEFVEHFQRFIYDTSPIFGKMRESHFSKIRDVSCNVLQSYLLDASLTAAYGVAVDVGVVVAVDVAVVVGVVVVVGVAVTPDTGVAPIVGSGVTGMLVGRPLLIVGVSVGVGPLFNVLWVVLKLPAMMSVPMVQTHSTTRSAPTPIPT